MVCDICSKPGTFSIVKASIVREAVLNGFNPFKTGLAFDVFGNTYPSWRQSAINGPASMTDWNICGNCLNVIRTYANVESGNSKQKSGCFIATAVYGDINHPSVITLRKFRDEVLIENIFGFIFVKFYYLVSPHFAKWVNKNIFLKKIIKKYLDKFINSISK